MEIIKKVTKSLQVLKETLDDEYDTSSIPNFTEIEIDKLYRTPVKKNNIYSNLGFGVSCNQILKHKHLENHNLHILFYNFPELGKNSSKVTKTIIEKIQNFYEKNTNKDKDFTINPNDNIIIIINENITDTINNMINELNIKLHNNFDKNFKDDIIYKELEEKNINLESKHFRNATVFNIKNLQFNILNHELVDKHEVIRDSVVINDILKKCNCTENQLPIISKDDAVGKLKLICEGDICKIIRNNRTCGEYNYYRICRHIN